MWNPIKEAIDMKLYTRTGDTGKTSLIGGRADKDHIRIEAYGTLDELNSFTGLAAAELDTEVFPDLLEDLLHIQHELFDCGADLADIRENRAEKLNLEAVTRLENRIDVLTEEAPALERFILPGGTKAAAALHVARTVCRRAERQMVSLMKQEADVPSLPLQYVNRLSDYFFAAARIANARDHVQDVEYERSAIVFRLGKGKEDK